MFRHLSTSKEVMSRSSSPPGWASGCAEQQWVSVNLYDASCPCKSPSRPLLLYQCFCSKIACLKPDLKYSLPDKGGRIKKTDTSWRALFRAWHCKRRMHTNAAIPNLSGPFACSCFPPLCFSILCMFLIRFRHLLAYLHAFYLCPQLSHTCARMHTQRTPLAQSQFCFSSSADNLKGRQLLHTTYKMFMTAAGVEGELLSLPVPLTSCCTHSRWRVSGAAAASRTLIPTSRAEILSPY